jgi:hypothetical protein
MKQCKHSLASNGRNRHGIRRTGPLAALTLALCGACVGCNGDEALRAFRDAATSSLQSGFKLISSGIIDGAFAVFQLGAQGSSGSAAGGAAGNGNSTETSPGAGAGGGSSSPGGG